MVHIRGFCYKQGFRNFCYRLTFSVQTEQGFLRLTIREREQVFRPLILNFFSPPFSQPSHLCSVQKEQGFLHIRPQVFRPGERTGFPSSDYKRERAGFSSSYLKPFFATFFSALTPLVGPKRNRVSFTFGL
jgi:hypothetical protein